MLTDAEQASVSLQPLSLVLSDDVTANIALALLLSRKHHHHFHYHKNLKIIQVELVLT